MKNYNNKGGKPEGALRLLGILLAIGFFVYVAIYGLGADQSGSMNDIKLGLDLAGGVSITYEAVGEEPSSSDMADTKYKLQLRAQTYSTEAEVYLEGANRINVDIPGVSDANEILEDLGKPGSLAFKDKDGQVLLTGSDIESAKAGIQEKQAGSKDYVVYLNFTEEGAKKFAEATANLVGQPLYIVYDNEIVSSPTVNQAITGGQAYIEGMGSYEAADILASTIRIGALPIELQEIRSNVVGAKLGEEAINTSLKAGAIGLAIVMLFMIVFYLVPGVAASIALSLYVGLIIFLLSAFKLTLTLPGIAGIILSIGMAVDANIIIFARIREELESGKTVRSAMKEGFSKAMSAILDGNITTLIAAFVLWWRGSGTVRGFAQTLALGIVLSMFTALFVTRFVLTGFYQLGLTSPGMFGMKQNREKKEKRIINFLGKKNICFVASLVVIIAGFVAMGVYANGSQGSILNYSLEFKGGTSTNVVFNEDKALKEIQDEVVPVVSQITKDNDIQTQKVAGANEVIIKTRTLSVDERESLNTLLAEKFGIDTEKVTAESISSTVSTEMKRDAIIAVVVATIAMLIYIWLRFKDVKFAASAVIALLHDVLVVLAFYAITKWTVGNTFIACMLTIVGYSINATIVIFDRIRENLKLKKKEDLKEVVNLSITQTLARSINTSITTFIMVFVLYLLGVSAIQEFALPLIVGIVCGAYSSVCITGALWYTMKQKTAKK